MTENIPVIVDMFCGAGGEFSEYDAGCIPSLLIPDFIADRSARKKYYPVPEYVIPVSVGVLIDREKMSEHPPLEDRPPGFVSAAQLYLERQNSAESAGGQIQTLADLW